MNKKILLALLGILASLALVVPAFAPPLTHRPDVFPPLFWTW